MQESYSPVNKRLRQLLADLRLRVDYDADLTTLTVYPIDEDSAWGVLNFDGVPAGPYERDIALIEAIEDHPMYEKIIDSVKQPLEKQGVALTDLDGKTWYAASTRRVKTLRPAQFGANGRVVLYSFEDLALISTLDDAGRRRVGFNKSGDQIRGTLQLENPDKVQWSRTLYLYEVNPKDLDTNRIYRRAPFQFEVMDAELKPGRVYTSNLLGVRQRFKVEPMFSREAK